MIPVLRRPLLLALSLLASLASHAQADRAAQAFEVIRSVLQFIWTAHGFLIRRSRKKKRLQIFLKIAILCNFAYQKA